MNDTIRRAPLTTTITALERLALSLERLATRRSAVAVRQVRDATRLAFWQRRPGWYQLLRSRLTGLHPQKPGAESLCLRGGAGVVACDDAACAVGCAYACAMKSMAGDGVCEGEPAACECASLPVKSAVSTPVPR